MFMLEIMQKTMRTSMEAVVKKLGIRKGRILEVCAAMNMAVGNTFFKKRTDCLQSWAKYLRQTLDFTLRKVQFSVFSNFLLPLTKFSFWVED